MANESTSGIQAHAAPQTSVLEPKSPNALCRRERSWQVNFDGDMFYLCDSIGLEYLARLLANPGRRIPSLRFLEKPSSGAKGSSQAGVDTEYRCHLDELRAELDESETYNDLGRSARLRFEIEVLIEQLSRDAGFCRRTEESCTAWERARKRVSNALRRTLGRIERHCPPLGAHFAATIRTGTYCIYLPDPYSPIRWLIDPAAPT